MPRTRLPPVPILESTFGGDNIFGESTGGVLSPIGGTDVDQEAVAKYRVS